MEQKQALRLTIIGIAVVLCLGIYQKDKTALTALESQIDTEKSKNIALKSLEMVDKMSFKYKELINNKDIEKSVDVIQEMASRANVKIDSLNSKSEEYGDVFVSYPYALSLTAKNFHEIGKFLSLLESHSNIYIIRDLKIKPVQNFDGEYDSVKAEISVFTVLLRD